MGLHIIVTGSPVDGLTFHGPFNNADEALQHTEMLHSDWWIAPLAELIENAEQITLKVENGN